MRGVKENLMPRTLHVVAMGLWEFRETVTV